MNMQTCTTLLGEFRYFVFLLLLCMGMVNVRFACVRCGVFIEQVEHIQNPSAPISFQQLSKTMYEGIMNGVQICFINHTKMI